MDQKKKQILLEEKNRFLLASELIPFFFRMLDQIDSFDGKVFYVKEEENPKYLKVYFSEFKEAYKNMEKMYLNLHLPIDTYKTIEECILTKKPLYVQKEEVKQSDDKTGERFESLRIEDAVYLPVIKGNEEIIGLIFLFKSQKIHYEQIIDSLLEIMDSFYFNVKKGLKIEKVLSLQEEINLSNTKYKKILNLASQMNLLDDPMNIFKTFIHEMMLVFGFEMGFIQMEKDGYLPMVEGTAVNEETEKVLRREKEYFGRIENAYKIFPLMNPDGGVCCFSYVNKSHFYFYEVASLKGVPMSSKDRLALELAGDSLKTLLQMPVADKDTNLGIIQFWSFSRNILLKDNDIELIRHVCSFIPSMVQNSKLHSLVEKQKSELIEKSKLVQEKNRELLDDLKLARQIQQNLIPKKLPSLPGIQIAAMYKPMEEIGGDFYDFIYFPERNCLSFFISDVSGHGIPAALITTMLKTLIQTAGDEKYSPGEMLSYINGKITGQTNGNFITAFYGLLNLDTKELKYARASHNFPFLIRGKELFELESRGKILGITSNLYFEEKSLLMKSKDKLFLFTDGLTEAVNSDKVDFETKLPEILVRLSNKPVQDLLDQIYSELLQFSEKYHFDDDVCLACIEIEEEGVTN